MIAFGWVTPLALTDLRTLLFSTITDEMIGVPAVAAALFAEEVAGASAPELFACCAVVASGAPASPPSMPEAIQPAAPRATRAAQM
tara:strand:+ start:1714 stop:1971 length:258 start_codon:yes stop_codon:yes gene_type:complete